MSKRKPLRDRLLSKALIDWETGCWDWAGARFQSGYGMIRHNQQLIRAHRVAYELFVGEIPEGLTLDHLCRNRACIRPDHLEPVTRGENTLRGEGPSARNARRTHCTHGHPLDEENTYVQPKTGYRYCRMCKREESRRRRRRGAAA